MAATTSQPPDDTSILCETGVAPTLYRDRAGAKMKVAGPTGLIGHLARTSRETARTHGVVVAAQEIVTMESFLREFRTHLLATPPAVRGDAYNVGLTMIELMIMREALSRPRPQPAAQRPSLAASCAER